MHAIYIIENDVTGMAYVGSAADLMSRFRSHKHNLRHGQHQNAHLQNSWHKHGEDAFSFAIIERVADRKDLLGREQHWMDELDTYATGFNQNPTAKSPFGLKRTVATRALLSRSSSGRKLSFQDEYEICWRYVGGEYTPSLAREYNLSSAKEICMVLERNGISRRTRAGRVIQ